MRDSVTGEPAAEGASGSLTYGRQTIPLQITRWDRACRPLGMSGGSHPGSYDIRIEKPGYRVWERRNVRVEDSHCGTITERIEALLQPAES